MDANPYHRDELAAQELAGGGAPGGAIRNFMPDQHRQFFAAMPYLFAAVPDKEGWPLATVLTGEPGFIRSPDPVTLAIDALPAPDDPALQGFSAGQPVGLLGLDLATRRRNRANGGIAALGGQGFSVAVEQSFGNCPKYIQLRRVRRATATPAQAEPLSGLDAEAAALIGSADTFFVASRAHARAEERGGCDISHRGGLPGFVVVGSDRLTVPDFSGNRYYNTLGNLLGEPRAGLLFIDFETGDLLQLQGTVEIDWEPYLALRGAERSWRFEVERGWRRRGALPLRFSLVEVSPFALATGIRRMNAVSAKGPTG